MGDHHNAYYSLVFVILFSGFTMFSSSVHAFEFIVGGKDGWGVLNPSAENYNRWAERLRFQVNDTLLFKYKKGSDSVVVVSKDDYDRCNSGNPKAKMDNGNSIFKFNRSGPFFFISGNKSSCGHGEKLIVVVLAVRSNHSRSPPPHPKAPSPAASLPRWSPHSPAPQSGEAPAISPAEAPAPESGYVSSMNPTPSGETTPAAHPPRRSFAVSSWSSSVLLVSTVSIVINACLGGFINFT